VFGSLDFTKKNFIGNGATWRLRTNFQKDFDFCATGLAGKE